MIYESFFHLDENPFGVTPDPRFLYRSAGHRHTLAYLAYGVFGKRGFITITGEAGIGKTTVIRTFVEIFCPCLEVAFVLTTRVNFEEMLFLILHDFGCEIQNESKVGMLTTLNSFLIDKFAQGQTSVLIIDEAQNLAPEVLEELRMLSNLETNQEKLIQIVLAGQLELERVLERHDLRQLRQRIAGILRMRALTEEEVDEYVSHRLRVAGHRTGNLTFTPCAQRALHAYSGGIPRLINTICDRTLVKAFIERTRRIGSRIVDESARELGLHPYS
jgi:type II secretory pathway predicted ATPase ExeA